MSIEPSHILIVKDPWASLILNGKKQIELRTTNTRKINQEIFIAKAGTKKIFGKITILHSKLISNEEIGSLEHKHLVSSEHLQNMNYHQKKKIYAWHLIKPISFDTPIDYIHPKGAQTWVKYKNTISNTNI